MARRRPEFESAEAAILRTVTKCEKWQGGALQFEPGEAGAEGAKLKKFSDAGGSQIQWPPDAGRFTLCDRSRYKLKKFSDAGGRKGGGGPTQPEPIFESRAV